MSDNGVKDIIKVTLVDGQMKVSLASVNLAILSHALRLTSLQLDNELIKREQAKIPKVSPISVSPDILKQLRKGK